MVVPFILYITLILTSCLDCVLLSENVCTEYCTSKFLKMSIPVHILPDDVEHKKNVFTHLLLKMSLYCFSLG